MRTRPLLLSCLLAGIVLLASCSSRGSAVQPPTEPVTNHNEPLTQQNQIDTSATIGPDGGSLDLDWFRLDFASGALKEPVIVSLRQSTFQCPREGVVAGGVPLHISIRPTDYSADILMQNPLAEGGYYTVAFNLATLPPNGTDADFSSANRNIDIVAEWPKPSGGVGTGCAWAHRKGDSISTFPKEIEITLAVVNYSNIAEISGKCLFTDDPRQVDNLYGRSGQGEPIPFDAKNLGPLGTRIPVLLIHGLNLFAQWAEPESISDESADYGYQSWGTLLNFLKDLKEGASDWTYSHFKFFWFCYPTGNAIFGPGSSAMMLNDEMAKWASANDPDLLNRPVVIIAHSQGGLVAREWMQNQGGNVYRLFTVCTPHLGSPVVNILYDMFNHPGYGWISDFMTPGNEDLACNEAIKYSLYEESQHPICSLLNSELGKLNEDLSAGDPRLVCYGATDTHLPNNPPVITGEKFCLEKLKRVEEPGGFVEGADGYYSDCVVPWRSQYYRKTGELEESDFARNSTTKYHCSVLSDDKILYRLQWDLIHSIIDYPQPGPDNFQWAKTWGGADEDMGYGVAVDGSGNAYVTGPFEGSVDFDPGSGVDNHTSNGKLDVFLSMFDSSGNFQWARTWGGSGDDRGYGVAVDGSGNAYVTGYFEDTVDFDPGPSVDNHTSSGAWGVFLSTFDSSGNFLWAKTWGWSYYHYGPRVAVDGSGNAYVTGAFYGTVDFDPNPVGVDNHTSNNDFHDVFLSKFDSSGNFKWARTWGGSSYDDGLGVAVDGSENVYVTGWFCETVDFDPGPGVDNHTSYFGGDIFLSKFNSSGDFKWAKTWGWAGGAGAEMGKGVAVDGSGNAYVTGWFYETVDFDPDPGGVDNHTSHGGEDVFLSKFDSSGNFKWAKTWGGILFGDGGLGVAVDGSGNAYVTGDFLDIVDFDPGPGVDNHTSSGSSDAFLSKFEPK